MWILKNSKGVIYYLTTEKEHVVSRKDGDLILENDQSISRRHAVVSVTYNSQPLGDIKNHPEVTVMDTNSKYGTFVSDGTNELKKLTSNVRQTIQNGFCIRFGLQWNEWKLQHLPLVITTSTLSPEEKRRVQKDILTLGGHVVNNWIPDVTHVVISRLMLTVKVVCALAYGKPIVTPQYWQNYVAAISNRKEPPDYREFLPPLAESTLNMNEVSFDINENRRTLFSQKCVFFSTQRQFNSYACMVNAAGGRTEILDLNNYPYEYYFNPDCIVLQYASDRRSQESQVPKEFEDLTRLLKEHGKRIIPESEIALAVLFCSLEKHCNPEFNAASSLVSSKVGINETGPNLLAMDTQESMPPSLHFETKIIPETGVVPTPETSGKSSSDKNIENSVSVCTENVASRRSEAGSGKQSQITDYIKIKRGDKPIVKVSDSESKNVQGHKTGENIQQVPVMDNETMNIIKVEQMSPVPNNLCNRVKNFTVSSSLTSKKRPGEENADIQCITKKIKSSDRCESVDSSNSSKLDGKNANESNKDSGASVMLESEDCTKIGKVVETPNKVLKQENHDNCDAQEALSNQQTPQGVKRKYAFNDDNDVHSLKRHSAADFDYSNCSTLPVEERLSAMSLKGFISTDAQKKKTSISSINDALDDTTAAEEMTLIEFKELVVRKDNNTSVKNTFTEQLNNSIINFKKFRKVQSTNRRSVPVEFYVQNNNMNKAPEIINEFLDVPPQRRAEADDGGNGSGGGGGGGGDDDDDDADADADADDDDGVDGGNEDIEDWFFTRWKGDQTRSVN